MKMAPYTRKHEQILYAGNIAVALIYVKNGLTNRYGNDLPSQHIDEVVANYIVPTIGSR